MRDSVLALIRRKPGIDDDALARALKITKARAARAARAFETSGLVERRRDPETGRIANRAIPTPEELARRERERERRHLAAEATALTEDEVRSAVIDWLTARGFDIDRPAPSGAGSFTARRGDLSIACESLGGGKHLSLPRNTLPRSLARLVERLGRGHAVYALAFPDLPAFRSALEKITPEARRSLNLHACLVRRRGGVFDVRAIDPRGRPVDLL